VGEVRFPAVVPGTADGCVYRAVASELPRGELTPVPAQTEATVRARVSARWPTLPVHGLRLFVSAPEPGDVWQGRSHEAALLCALVSAATGVPPRHGVVVTGALSDNGIDAVGEMAGKAVLVRRDVDGGRLVSGPSDVDAMVDAALDLGWRAAVQPRRRSGRRLARRARVALLEGDFREARARARQALEVGGDAASEALDHWVLGAVALHEGEADVGVAALEAAMARADAWDLAEGAPPEAWTRQELTAWLLVGAIDTGLVVRARDWGMAALRDLRVRVPGPIDVDVPAPYRDARWRMVALQLAGSTHRAATALGELDLAATLLRDISLASAVLDEQRARCLCDLAEVHRRSGALGRAARCLDEAEDALLDTSAAERPRTRRFLALYRGRLALARGESPGVRAEPGDGVWPGIGLSLLVAEAARDVPAVQALLDRPVVQGSQPLQWACVAALARLGAPVADTTRGWRFDDPTLAGWAVDAATPDAVRGLAERCPY
jgi:hypothetical protein